LELTDKDLSAPAKEFFELKYDMTTWAALLGTLFGYLCPYIQDVWTVRKILDEDEVEELHESFLAVYCRQITCAMIFDGRSYFNPSKAVTPEDFTMGYPDIPSPN